MFVSPYPTPPLFFNVDFIELGRRLVGFSAFPDGGRFEALRRTGPGEEKPVAVQIEVLEPWE